jgi:hypothetical protein
LAQRGRERREIGPEYGDELSSHGS